MGNIKLAVPKTWLDVFYGSIDQSQVEQLAAENDDLESMIGAIETKGMPLMSQQHPSLGLQTAGQPLSSHALPGTPPKLARSGSSNSSVTVY